MNCNFDIGQNIFLLRLIVHLLPNCIVVLIKEDNEKCVMLKSDSLLRKMHITALYIVSNKRLKQICYIWIDSNGVQKCRLKQCINHFFFSFVANLFLTKEKSSNTGTFCLNLQPYSRALQNQKCLMLLCDCIYIFNMAAARVNLYNTVPSWNRNVSLYLINELLHVQMLFFCDRLHLKFIINLWCVQCIDMICIKMSVDILMQIHS